MGEKEIGQIENYFGKIGVAVVRVTEGTLRVGDRIAIRGSTTDTTQVVESMQVEHTSVDSAGPGDLLGLKVKEKVRENDRLYLITED